MELRSTFKNLAPLSERMRPRTLEEFMGQEHIVSSSSSLFNLVRQGLLGSTIFYGPPGTGKTTLASIIALNSGADFVKLNAVSSGVSDAKEIISKAKDNLKYYGKKTYLLLDECHRWNKAQSDSVLEAIEKGYIIFIGSTTENPYTSMTRAIVSRCKIYEFKPLSRENVKSLLKKALSDNERGYGSLDISCSEETLDAFVSASAGDARSALNALENAVLSTEMDENKKIVLTPEIALDCSKNNILALDTDMYYDMLSAFCKSLRGSDADASLYWAFRMIESGIDPMIIFRRLIAHASEDVGLASSNALLIAVSAMQAYEKMGKPEGLLPLSHAIIYVAMSPKSNSVITAMDSARADAVNSYNGQVPAHLKNTNYMNEKREKYIYPHDKGGYVKQQYLPDEFKDRVYYVPSNNGSEKSIKLDEDKIKNIKPKK